MKTFVVEKSKHLSNDQLWDANEFGMCYIQQAVSKIIDSYLLVIAVPGEPCLCVAR